MLNFRCWVNIPDFDSIKRSVNPRRQEFQQHMLHFIWQIIWKPLTNYAIEAIIGRRDQECFEGFFISCEMNLLLRGLWLNELCPERSWSVHFKRLYLMGLLSLEWDQESSNVSSSLGFYPAPFLALPPRLCLSRVAWVNQVVSHKNKYPVLFYLRWYIRYSMTYIWFGET